MSALSLLEAKEHLNIGVSTYDPELQSMIDAAETIIAQHCGPLTSTTTTAMHVVGNGATQLVLPVTPAISLTSVTPNIGSALTLGDLSVYPWGVVEYTTTSSFGLFYRAWYTVVYLSGRASVPPGLLYSIKEMTRHLWTTQRGGASRPGAPAAGTVGWHQGFLIPNSVREGMEPYAQFGTA